MQCTNQWLMLWSLIILSANTTLVGNTACDAAAKLQHNGCLFTKSEHTLLLIQHHTFSSAHPTGTIHCVSDVEYLPSQRFFYHSQPHSHSNKSEVASRLQKKKKKPVRLHARGELSVLFPLTSLKAWHWRSPTVAKSFWLNSLEWNV